MNEGNVFAFECNQADKMNGQSKSFGCTAVVRVDCKVGFVRFNISAIKRVDLVDFVVMAPKIGLNN